MVVWSHVWGRLSFGESSHLGERVILHLKQSFQQVKQFSHGFEFTAGAGKMGSGQDRRCGHLWLRLFRAIPLLFFFMAIQRGELFEADVLPPQQCAEQSTTARWCQVSQHFTIPRRWGKGS